MRSFTLVDDGEFEFDGIPQDQAGLSSEDHKKLSQQLEVIASELFSAMLSDHADDLMATVIDWRPSADGFPGPPDAVLNQFDLFIQFDPADTVLNGLTFSAVDRDGRTEDDVLNASHALIVAAAVSERLASMPKP